MKKFTIYTENKPGLSGIVGRYFESFTILEGVGFWKESAENSAVIVVLSDEELKAYQLARAIKRENNQEAVLVESQYVTSEVI